MLIVETIARIRREYFLKGKTIREIARELRLARNTVRKVVRSGTTRFAYDRETQPRPKLGEWTAELDELLGVLEEVPIMVNRMMGGSADTDTTEVAVNPTGPSGPFNVTTATPAGCERKADRNMAESSTDCWDMRDIIVTFWDRTAFNEKH